jgi:hypothetical protein
MEAQSRVMDTSRHPTWILAATIAALLVTAAPPALAARKTPASQEPHSEAMYRCRDAQGRLQVGQSIPPECMDLDVEVLDRNGQVTRTIPGRRSLEQLSQQKAVEDAAKARVQRDKTLLATYLSVADIERLRDQRLELLEQQSRTTHQYITNLRDRQARLMVDVQRYRPYNDSPKAPPLPDHVSEDIVNTVNGLQVYEQELTKLTADQEQLRAEFAADVARFKELKGLK